MAELQAKHIVLRFKYQRKMMPKREREREKKDPSTNPVKLEDNTKVMTFN